MGTPFIRGHGQSDIYKMKTRDWGVGDSSAQVRAISVWEQVRLYYPPLEPHLGFRPLGEGEGRTKTKKKDEEEKKKKEEKKL